MRPSPHAASLVPGFLASVIFLLLLPLAGCAVAPTVPSEAVTRVHVSLPAEKAKAILEKIQKDHPAYTIRALLKPEASGTDLHLTVFTVQTVHMAVRGFQEPTSGKKLYPDCNRWFDLTRSFDPACGGGPYLGSANLVFGDGMALGLMFDLFQAARYPFAYTRTPMPDEKATRSVLEALKAAEKSAGTQTSSLLAGNPPMQ